MIMMMKTTTNNAWAAIIALTFFPGLVHAAPQPTPLTPELIEAAKKEGKIVYYRAIDIKVAQSLAKAFEQKYPGITVQVKRTGSERLYQRVSQERASNIFTPDIYDATDQDLFVAWKKEGVLEPFIPADPVAQEAATEEIKKKYSQYFGI